MATGHHNLWAKEERDRPTCYQLTVQMPASVMVLVHICEGTVNAEQYVQVLDQQLQQLNSSDPRGLHSVVKRKSDATQW